MARVPKGERTRERILEAAADTFRAKGYGNTMVKDILERTGLARGTFYIYFKGKDEALLALLHEMLQEQEEVIQRLQSDAGAGKSTVSALALAEELLKIYDKHSYLHRSFIEAALTNPAIMDEFTRVHRMFSSILLRMLSSDIGDGAYTRGEMGALSQVLVAAAGFSAFLRAEGVISCSRPQLASSLAYLFSGITGRSSLER